MYKNESNTIYAIINNYHFGRYTHHVRTLLLTMLSYCWVYFKIIACGTTVLYIENINNLFAFYNQMTRFSDPNA